jgi:Kef-type K+ transport system membrane component KefB
MSPVSLSSEHLLLSVLWQLVLVIGAARVCGLVFHRFGQPQVCGEIAAGLILGPSILGRAFPQVTAVLFQGLVGPVFTVLSQLGLILLMFLIGLEFNFDHLRELRRTAVWISASGIVLPFALGILVAGVLHPVVAPTVSVLGFSLFIATALSITALPILGRMMVEFNLNHTRLGCLTITAAACDDVVGWVILGAVSALVQSAFDPWRTLAMVAAIAAFGAVVTLGVRPLVIRWSRSLLRRHDGRLPLDALTIILVLVLLSALATDLIGIFSVFGAFLMGAILFDQQELREALIMRLRDFVTVFFLPIFFTYTGLRTDIGTMQGGTLWMMCLLVLGAAIVGKLVGCGLAARFSGLPPREAWAAGIMMNTRALMELIVINIGYDMGVIPKSVFFMLVLMAVSTTFMTTPLLRLALRTTALEAAFHPPVFRSACIESPARV